MKATKQDGGFMFKHLNDVRGRLDVSLKIMYVTA
jgi:hypothetical protein